MNKSRMLYALMAVGLFIARTGEAQEAGSEPFRVGMTVVGEHTDNRDSTPEEADNTDLFVGPEIGSYLDYDRTLLDFYYSPRYRYRTDPSPIQNEDEFHHDLSLRLEHDMTPRLRVRVRERYNYTDDPTVTEAGATLRRDASFSLNRVNAGFNYQLTDQVVFDVEGRHMVKRYDDDEVADESDEDRAGVFSSLQRYLDEYTSIGLIGSYDAYDSDNSEGLERGFSVTMGGVAFEKRFSPHFATSLRAGAQFIEYDKDDERLDEDTRPYGTATVKLSGSPATLLILEADYSVRDGYSFPFTSMEHTHVYAKGEYEVTPRTKLIASCEYRVEDYDEDALTQAAFDRLAAAGRNTSGEETTVLATASAIFKLNDKTRLQLTQLYEDVESDVFVTFTRNATRLAVTRDF